MSKESRPCAALSCLSNAVWTVTTISAVAAFLLAFLPEADGPALLDEVAHPGICRACAYSSPEARAVRDASLIWGGAIEAPPGSDGLPREKGRSPQAAPDGV